MAACGTVDTRQLGPDQSPNEEGGAPATGGTGGRSSSSSGKGGTHQGSGGTSVASDAGAAPGGTDGVGLGLGGSGDESSGGDAICGNGKVEKGEECDDGNLQAGDGCDAQCRQEKCGNGRVDAGEQCDPPKAGQCTDHCNTVQPGCGNGIVEGDEECDDGNDKAGDGCFECVKECGDGKIDASIGEDCEPEYAPLHCSLDCHWLPTCGDGIVQTDLGEQCDPGDGVTCIACKLVTPPSCDDPSGCGGAGSDSCMPDSGPVNNGTFDATSDGWTASTPSVTLSVANDGSPSPKSLEVALSTNSVRSEAGAYQCVPVHGGVKYTFDARYRISSDVPDDVSATATALLYTGTQCSGTFMRAFNGPAGTVRDAWTPYSFALDLSQVSSTPQLRLLLRLDVIEPANVDGSRVRWDSISLAEPGPRCGDCTVDPGEECDHGILDGTTGDLCNVECHLERCGDGLREGLEQCDDGNTTFASSDTCTPACRTATGCDTCSAGQCATDLDACFGLKGLAMSGPRAGTARSTLCDELLTCVRNTACDLVPRVGVDGHPQVNGAIADCYCGTSGADCFDESKPQANGSCRAQIEAALESTNPTQLAGRFDGSESAYPILETVRELIACQTSSCTSDCGRNPRCGDGLREDRNLSLTMRVDGKDVACDDALTTTGRGCSFEECDGGDNCDQNCLLIACGNYVTQGSEDCDDGDANGTPGDGCSSTCTALYHCGDGNVEAPYEACDPPPGTPPGVVCTLAQSQSDPSSCACDNKCKLVVCGNGFVQAPEQCDPPDGASCNDNCQLIGRTACEDCIATSQDAETQSMYCDGTPSCLLVERCVIKEKCFNPLPQFCYCGTQDLAACGAASFTPTGPCVDEIKGAASGTVNGDILNQLFDFTQPVGVAYLILNDINVNVPDCVSQCF
jgi:cysteine-rich repeat protein